MSSKIINRLNQYWDYNHATKKLLFTFPNNLRNNNWAEEFGDFYGVIENNVIYEVLIDISLIKWVDPIPLMSILVLFAQKLHIPKERFIINLPKEFDDELIHYENSRFVIMKFLLKEGFLSLFDEIGVFLCKNKKIDLVKIKNTINKMAIELNYFDCHLMDVKVIDTDKIHEKGEDGAFYSKLEEIMKEISVNLYSKKIPFMYCDNILYKIRLFFSETINNVYQYAYPDTNKKNVAIYCRYRYGLQNNSIESYKIRLKKLLIDEVNNSSLLYRECKSMVYDLREGCIELFVVDVGVGIAESFGVRVSNFQHPTRKAYQDILNTSMYRKNSRSTKKTLNGGLYVIGQHIEERRDFVLFKDREEWLGGILPDRRQNNFYDSINAISSHTPGCIVQATFSWHPINSKIENWDTFENNNIEDRFWSIYKKGEYNINILDEYSIIDERFDYEFNIISKKTYIRQCIRKDKNTIIYLPHRGMTKHLMAFVIIPTILEESKPGSTLIIADIPDDERLTYYAAINEVYYSKSVQDLLKNINKIVLVSASLSTCVFVLENNKYFKKRSSLDFMTSAGDVSMFKTLELLMIYDSYKIWDSVNNSNVGELFINSQILWAKNIVIENYLDFNRLCSVPNFIKIFLISLRRVIGFCNLENVKFKSLDVLAENLVARLSDIYPTKNTNNVILHIGSVYVHGLTQSECLQSYDDRVVHCFQHPYSKSEPIIKLFVWPQQKWIQKRFAKTSINYKRIGRTSAIAIDGWQYYSVPRYKLNGESFYYMPPRKTYILWQNPQLGLRLGHFKYCNSYDLIKINIKAFVEKSFLEKSSLSRYLIANFYYALDGNNLELITDPDFRKIDDNIDDLKKFYNENNIIVYPNHPTNNIIIEKISSIISPRLMEKVIPLNYVRTNNSQTNILFSPLNFDKIKSYINEKKMGVIFFDDAVVSGRTRKEIKHLLLSFCAKEVKTLAIIDRQRLPYSVPNQNTQKYYCRLDIPRLGAGGENIMMAALNKAKNSTALINSAKNRISVWCNRWYAYDSFDNFNANVLNPISINPLSMKFSTYKKIDKYEQIGGDDNKILITNSIGLIAYCLELFCMTGRDDIVLKYTERIQDKRVQIEIICTHILLYGQQLSLSLKYDLLRQLLVASNYNEYDTYSSLAAIVFLTQDNDLITRLSNTPEYINTCNFDIQIAFAINFLGQNQTSISDSYNNIISYNKLQNNQGLINIKDFHRQIYEKRQSHISPLYAIINGNKPIDVRINALKTSLEKLAWHCEQLFPSYGVDGLSDPIQGIHKCESLITEYFIGSQEKEILNQIETVVSLEILPPLNVIHDQLFFNLKFGKKNNY